MIIFNFYFCRSSDNVKDFSAILKVLVDPAYQPTSNTADKDAARSMLEENFEKLIKVLESNQAGPRVLEKTITMKSMLFNIYKEARQSSRFSKEIFLTNFHDLKMIISFSIQCILSFVSWSAYPG